MYKVRICNPMQINDTSQFDVILKEVDAVLDE